MIHFTVGIFILFASMPVSFVFGYMSEKVNGSFSNHGNFKHYLRGAPPSGGRTTNLDGVIRTRPINETEFVDIELDTKASNGPILSDVTTVTQQYILIGTGGICILLLVLIVGFWPRIRFRWCHKHRLETEHVAHQSRNLSSVRGNESTTTGDQGRVREMIAKWESCISNHGTLV